MKKKWCLFRLLVIVVLVIIFIEFGSHEKEIKNEVDSIQEEVIEEVKDVKHEAKLTLFGDFLYEQLYYDALEKGDDISNYFSKVRKYFEDDDISVGNMEVVMTDGNMEISGSNYTFCAPEIIGKEIASLDLEVLGLSNNHSNDRGIEGRISTKKFFKENSDILTVGVYDDETRDVSNNIIEVNGIKFGFLAYTYGTNKIVPYNERYSLGLFKDPETFTITDEYKSILTKEISYLRERVDCLVVLMHWGREFTFDLSEEQIEATELLNDLGVDIIVGAHSHNMQPIKWINGEKHSTLVYYSLGNFVSADLDPRASNTFINAYNIDLISRLTVVKDKENIIIKDIETEPIINYFDKDFRNFLLVPFKEYEEYETSHKLYEDYGFDINFINDIYNNVIDEEYRKQITLSN